MEKREPSTLLGRMQPLWRTVWRFLKKLKIELSYDTVIPFLGIYPEKTMVPKYAFILHSITRK